MGLGTIVQQVRSRVRSAREVAVEVLERRAAYDLVQPQAWIYRTPEAALLAQADAIDARLAAGEHLPLAGAPFAVKDNIDAAGLPTTAACPAFEHVAQVSAPVVQRLIDAGALLVGKTNLDQFATGLVGARSPYGAPRCVFNLDYISGGSSSGSAVVTAAGIVAFALGTDTAGSGRVPAAFNGLVGFKPTRGRWSTRGVVPACRSLDCVTVFAATVADAAAVDAVLAAFDPEDPYSRRTQADGADLRRAGAPLPSQRLFLGDGESGRLYEAALDRLAGLGVEISEIDIGPLLEAARLLYAGPWVAERAAAIEPLLRQEPGAIDPVVREIVEPGLSITAVEAFRGQYQLKAHQRAAEAVWERVDALLLPTAPTCYRLREIVAAPVALNSHLGLYTNFVNLLDMSAVAVPAGFRANGTGFGVTFVAAAFADRQVQALAHRFEETAEMTTPPLDLMDRPAETVRLAVVGAHLEGMPLHWQLISRAAKLVARTRTAPVYRLYAMARTTPPKPALVHCGDSGAAIEVEVYEMPIALFGSFVAEVPAPLAIGTVTLEDGEEVKGFVSEPRASQAAEDITALGGWRAYIAARA